ncbi:hypothetical protein [Halarchaeum sp. P4]|uniref:hypothetical protein n=1 Tax=Halarchaeum sp. P4 TaxID=3421639 RepID=UPI003EC056DD
MTLRDRLVREEFVGENRCWPCTALNAGIVAVAALALVLVSVPLALLVAVLGSFAIAYRGYVVPGTPRFAPRIARHLPVSFGHSERAVVSSGRDGATTDADASGSSGVAPNGDAVFDALVDAGVIGGSDDDLALDETFRADWRERMRAVRDRDVVAAVAETRPDTTVERRTDEDDAEWVVLRAGEPDETWLAPAVAVADVAAVAALDARGVSPDVALPAASALRRFLERCPACDGALAWETEGCCGGYGPDGPSRVLACEACGAAVFSE